MRNQVFLLMRLGKILSLLPESRLFPFKASIYRSIGGLDIDPTCQIYSSAKLYTYPIKIGARTHIGARVLFTGSNGTSINIGSDCDIGPEVMFITGTHEIGPEMRRAGKGIARPIIIREGTWIGARSMILPGVEIGYGCVVAAGSVVTENVPPNCLVAGVPAVIKRQL